MVQSSKPGLIEWLAATRDPSHIYHLKWRILQLTWMATSPEYARYLAGLFADLKFDFNSIQSEATKQLRKNLDALIKLQLPSEDPGAESDSKGGENSVLIWGSNAAILWSLLFTPAFGAYIQMRNWQALGQAEKARSSRYWLVAWIAFIPASTMIAAIDLSAGGDLYLREIIWVIFFAVWYFIFAKSQSNHFYNIGYGSFRKRPWMGILIVAFVLNVVVFFLDSAVLSGFRFESVLD
jgi:hypothetical protein